MMESPEAIKARRQREAGESAALRRQERNRARARVKAAHEALVTAEREVGAARRDLAFWEALGDPTHNGKAMHHQARATERIPEETTIEPWP